LNQRTPAGLKRLRELAETSGWYHSIELAPGVVTKGMFDHRPFVDRYDLPESLAGKRVLDVGTFEGFWAYEFERRGADVVALDVPRIQQLDWPPRKRPAEDAPRGDLFRIAAEARESAVRWIGLSVYDAKPERLDGTFDLVFCGSVLLHLRDPALALERMAGLCSGQLILAEPYSRRLEWIPRLRLAEFKAGAYETWWMPTTRTLRSMVALAGFEQPRLCAKFNLRFRGERRRGVPHAVIHARGPG
jgi:2-polyprenyl-3-methyl-5-hydroxy-6-metoxy-1,4-benzoquinol methylase